jgi:hypothetical protein
MIVDLLASPAVAGYSVSKIRGQGPWQAAMWAARDAGMTDDAKAAAAVRKAAHDTCPAYAHRLA